METKNSDDVVLNTFKWMEYASNHLVSPHTPGGGGLALFWKKELDIEILCTCDNFIDTAIRYKKEKLFATFVYGEPGYKKRISVWNALTQVSTKRSDAWFLTGDFNEILNSTEKTGWINRSEG